MATYRKRLNSWEVQVCCKGVRRSSTHRTRAECSKWAVETEAEILAGLHGRVVDKPVSALLERYRDTVSVKKRGERWERLRINLVLRDPFSSIRLPDLSVSDVASWRDRRLGQVSPSSVAREWNLLSHAFHVAVKEWRWLSENPFKSLSRPRSAPPRDRRISPGELDRLLFALGHDDSRPLDTVTSRVGAAVLFALETAMRCGEICSLTWSNVSGSVAFLPMTKNGFPRRVPLSPAALSILARLPRSSDFCFNLKTSQVDAIFRKAKARALIPDLHFHDTRHEAITRLASKLSVPALARMVGIRDLRILMVYYNESPEDIALKLA